MTDQPPSRPAKPVGEQVATLTATVDQLQAELERVHMIQALMIGALLALAIECSYILWRDHASR